MAYPYIRILLMVAIAVVVIAVIVIVAKKLKGSKTTDFSFPVPPAETPTPSPSTSTSTSTSPRTSTIFINGGAPASGNIMGKISVDGNSLTVRYTDAPVEITIPVGRHHVVVEGGVAGDARIDRAMEFGVSDVWTVDLPGGDDADVIRHQMIDYSTYRQALRDSNFRVTKREL